MVRNRFIPSTSLKITVNERGNVSVKVKFRRTGGDIITVEEQ
jgi:hypothetical protein